MGPLLHTPHFKNFKILLFMVFPSIHIYLILVGGIKFSLQLAGAELVLVLEELHGGGCARGLLLLVLLQPVAQGEGAAGVQVECDWDTVVASSNNGPDIRVWSQ